MKQLTSTREVKESIHEVYGYRVRWIVIGKSKKTLERIQILEHLCRELQLRHFAERSEHREHQGYANKKRWKKNLYRKEKDECLAKFEEIKKKQ